MTARFRLEVLGGIRLEGPDGPLGGAATQRRRLAVLALMAGNNMSRERIVAFLWPESSEERARHALAQLLYSLRRDFGEDVLSGSATGLSLNSAVMASDIDEFNSGWARGDLPAVAALYTGPFLDGFHLSGCAEFERWVDQERMRIAMRAHSAMETLAERCAADGDAVRALEWWQRLGALSPYDSRIAMRLAQALVAAGDRTRAIRFIRAHDQLLLSELNTRADAALLAFAETLTGSTDTATSGQDLAQPATASTANHAYATARPVPEGDAFVDPADGLNDVALHSPARTREARSRRWFWLSFAIPTVAVAALSFGLAGRSDPGPRDWVVIADLENATSEAIFDRAVTLALAAALQQSPRVYVMPPERVRQTLERMRRTGADSLLDEKLAREVAQREGARVVLVPALTQLDSLFNLSIRFIEPASGAVLRVVEERARRRDEVIDAIDRGSRRVRRSLGETRSSIAARSVPLPQLTTGSLEALQKYAEGQRAFAGDQVTEARLLFELAVRADTSFAAAYSALGGLEYYLNRPASGDRWFEHAQRHLTALPQRDQVLIRAEMHSWQGNRDSAVTLLRAHLLAQPHDLDASRQLGYEYMRLNQDSEALEVLQRVARMDTMDAGTLINLATVEKHLGRFADAIAHYKRAFALQPSLEIANNNLNHEYGITFIMAGDPAAAGAVFRKMLTAGHPQRARGLRSLSLLELEQGEFIRATELMAETVVMNRAAQASISELRNRLFLAGLFDLLDEGRAAAEQRDSAFALSTRTDTEVTLLYWLGKALARAGDEKRAGLVLERLEARARPGSRTDRAALEGLRGELLIARGDAQQALSHLERAYLADDGNIVLESLALGAQRAGAFERAAELYERLASSTEFRWEGRLLASTASYQLGRVYEQRGDRNLAVAAYQRFLGSPAARAGIWPVNDARNRLERLTADRGTPR